MYKSTDDWILTAQFLTQIRNFLYETKQAAISLIPHSPTLLWSRNNSVDNAARLLARRPSNFGSILGCGNRYFSSPKRPDRPWEALSFLFSGYQRLFPRRKRPGPEADNSPTRLTIRGAIPPFPPYAYMASTRETLPSFMYCNCASKGCLLLFQQIAGNF